MRSGPDFSVARSAVPASLPGSVRTRRRRFRRRWIIRLSARFLRADVVSQLVAGEVDRVALIGFEQHGCVPIQPLRNDAVVDLLVPLLQVGSLHWIVDDVEEERVFEDLEKLPIAVSRSPLRIGLVAPE